MMICDVCFVNVCSLLFLLSVPWGDCASWLWYFLEIFNYILVDLSVIVFFFFFFFFFSLVGVLSGTVITLLDWLLFIGL